METLKKMVLASGVMAPPNSSRGVERMPSPTICGAFSGGAATARAPRSAAASATSANLRMSPGYTNRRRRRSDAHDNRIEGEMSVPGSLRFTYEDYVLLPEDRRYEVIDGELYVTPAP